MKGGGRGIGGTAKSPTHKAGVPAGTHWLDARDACFDVAKEIGERRTVAGEKLRYPLAFLRAPSSLHVQCQSSLHCLSYHNGGTKPQPGDRTPLQSPSALCCLSSWRQRRRYRFSLPPYPPCSPTHHATPRFWSPPVPPFALGPQTTKLPPSVALPRGAHSALFSLSLSPFLFFPLFFSYYVIPCNPFPGHSTSSAAVRGRSCRFLKCKYQSRNKRQRLVVQDESIVSAWARIYVDVFRIAMLAPCSLVREINVRIVVNHSRRYLGRV